MVFASKIVQWRANTCYIKIHRWPWFWCIAESTDIHRMTSCPHQSCEGIEWCYIVVRLTPIVLVIRQWTFHTRGQFIFTEFPSQKELPRCKSYRSNMCRHNGQRIMLLLPRVDVVRTEKIQVRWKQWPQGNRMACARRLTLSMHIEQVPCCSERVRLRMKRLG